MKYPHLKPTGARAGTSREGLLSKYGEPIPIPGIEGGTIALLDFMGSDQAIVQSARTSYGKGVSEHEWNDEADDPVCAACGLTESKVVAADAGGPPYWGCSMIDRHRLREAKAEDARAQPRALLRVQPLPMGRRATPPVARVPKRGIHRCAVERERL